MDIINNYLAKKSSTNKQDKARGQDVKIKCLKAEKSKAEWVSTNLFMNHDKDSKYISLFPDFLTIYLIM